MGLRRDGDPGIEDDLQNELRSPKQQSPKHRQTRTWKPQGAAPGLSRPGGLWTEGAGTPHARLPVQDDFAQEPTAHAEARFLWMGGAPVKHKPTIAGGQESVRFPRPWGGGRPSY